MTERPPTSFHPPTSRSKLLVSSAKAFPFAALMAFVFLAGLVGPAHSASAPAPPQVAGEAAFLMDSHSDRVLASQGADKPWPPASLAKMLTLYTAFRAIEDGSVSMSDQVRVSEKAWRTKGSRMYLEVGDEVSLERLIKGIIVESGNDACVAVAEHVAGTEEAFVQLMNQHARKLGLEDSHFINASGLPPDLDGMPPPREEMRSTARDMAHLASALVREFPDHYGMFDIREMTYNDITQYNRNRLLWWDESVDGLKTGHTERSGYSLVASAEREGMRLISVVLGADSEQARAEASQSLLNYGFRFYRTYRLYQAGESIHEAPVWKGARRKVEVALDRDLYVTVPRGERERIEVTLDLRQPLLAPLDKGSEVGQIRVTLGDRELAERPLTTLQLLPEGGLLRQFTDSVRLWFAG